MQNYYESYQISNKIYVTRVPISSQTICSVK